MHCKPYKLKDQVIR